jgi:O-antigen/teichoic acid export membrane protein
MRVIAADIDAPDIPRRGLVQKFSWVALSGFGRQLAFFVVNSYLAYCLSKEMFGTLTCAFGSLMVFVGLADFGLRQVGWREVARNPQRIAAVVNSVLAARLLMTVVALVGFLAAATVYCHSARDWIVFLAYSFGLFFNMSSFDFPFLGRDKVDTLGRSYAISYAYFVPACLVTVHGDSTAWLVPVHFVVAHAILFVLLHRDYRRTVGPLKLSFERRELKHYFRESWSLGINSLLFRMAVNYPVLLLGVLLSSVAAAEYRMAEMFYALFASLGLYLGSSTFTTYASYDGDNDERIVESVSIAVQTILLCLIPIGFLFMTVLPTIFAAVFDGDSPNLPIICQLLGLSLPVAVTTRYLQTCLPSVGLNKELLKVNVANLSIGLGSGMALIATVGGWGVAASVLLSETTSLVLLLTFVKQKLPALKFGPMFAAPCAAGSIGMVIYFVAVAVGTPGWLQIAAPLAFTAPIAWWLSEARTHGKPSRTPTWTNASAADEPFAEPIGSKAA